MKKILFAVTVLFIIFILVLAFFPSIFVIGQFEIKPASDFTTVDENGIEQWGWDRTLGTMYRCSSL